jgi:lactoylglutathione lyase
MLQRMDHFALTVSNLERSLEFYCQLLGLKQTLRKLWNEEYIARMVGFDGASLDIAFIELPGDPPGVLEMIEYQEPRSEAPTAALYNAPGSAHLCFRVDDIQAMYQRLCAAEVEFVSAPIAVPVGPNKGAQTVYFFDPDRIIIQLMQAKPES